MRSIGSDMDERPPTSILNADAPTTSNAATPGSDAASGIAACDAKLCSTLTFSDAMTYSAPDGVNSPDERVDTVGSATLLAPSTAWSSYTLNTDHEAPSMS